MIEHLDLTMTGLTGEFMLELTKLPRLRHLKFNKTYISLDRLKQLASQFDQLGLNEQRQ